MSDSLQLHGLYSPWNSPGQNTGVCKHSLRQGIFPTQRLNPVIEPMSPALQVGYLPVEPLGNLFVCCDTIRKKHTVSIY